MEQLHTLERALGVLVCTFQRYCKKEGDKHTLSKAQLKELLVKELPSLQRLHLKEGTLEKLMASLDKNKDNQVDFEEFIRFVAAACTFFHDFFQDEPAVLPRVQDGGQPPKIAPALSEVDSENRDGDGKNVDLSEGPQEKGE
ncbi:protein S100-A2-like [Sceloporus undulatus]|uniref:protein S100-A2-like n=1 Tax=Sceloporus undulatus TaxID=8520 RepID=UPI001C4DD419|nr:protein S100-A2-like [Sceloporus undulatus]